MNLLPKRAPPFCLRMLASSLCCLSLASGVMAQTPAVSSITGSVLGKTSIAQIYTAMDFTQFTPRNALDMLNRVPGFAIQNDNQGRGLGQASTNVLINGQRLSSKSQDVFDQLRRITNDNVAQIEVVDGATLDMPGLSGQVANIVTLNGDISGRYEWRTIHRPKYAKPSWWGGELSVNGSTPSLQWNAAYTHGTGRGGAGGPGLISDGNDTLTETRDVHIQFNGEFPRLSGSVKWNGPNDMIANLNAQYSRSMSDNSNDEKRWPVNGAYSFRDFDNDSDGRSHELGGDIEFPLAFGTLKLIGLDRLNVNEFGQMSSLIFDDGTPTTGSRFLGESETAEQIGRSEFRWEMLGGNWEVDLEAAFNQLDQSSQLFNLEADGQYKQVALPNSSGQVEESRYEMIVTHGRTLTEGLSLQLGIGAEKSELSQTGPAGLTRDFWRGKGSLSLAWVPREGTDISLNIARKVGQLSFGDFLSSVSLALNNANAGNAQLRPSLTWESTIQIKQQWNDWGSTNVRLYRHWVDDYIDIVPIAGGGESRGNIDTADFYGINLTSTINLDPMGWEGVRLDISITAEDSSLIDPFTGLERGYSDLWDRLADISLRHDVSGTSWAWGAGIEYYHALPGYRYSQVALDYEGPVYTVAFIEHKDFYGMTVNFQVFNLTDGRSIYRRTVFEGLYNNSPILFHENRDLSVQPIFRLQFTGSF